MAKLWCSSVSCGHDNLKIVSKVKFAVLKTNGLRWPEFDSVVQLIVKLIISTIRRRFLTRRGVYWTNKVTPTDGVVDKNNCLYTDRQ